MLAYETQLFLITVAAIFFIGIPSALRTTRLPLRLQFREFGDNELTPEQRKFFADTDAAFSLIGYQPLQTFSIVNFQGANLQRTYYNSADPAVGAVTLLRDAKARWNTQHLEFVTRFEDGTKLNTKNSPVSTSMFKTLPWYMSKSFPSIKTPALLKQKHDERSAALGLQPVFGRPAEYQQRMQEHHDAWAGHQVKSRLLKLAPTGEFRATPMLGVRAAFGLLNPIAGDFTLGKFAGGIVLGAGVPILVSRYGLFASLWLTRTAGINPLLSYSVLNLGSFLLAGISVGTLFRQRSFIWGFLLAYLPPPLFHLRGAYPLLGSFIVACTADWTAKIQRRRGRLL